MSQQTPASSQGAGSEGAGSEGAGSEGTSSEGTSVQGAGDRASARPAPGTKAVIIGAGISGLATAGLLAREGYDVTVVEKRESIGGRAGLWEKDGFRFDTGPSWYLMPEVFDHFYELMGSSAAEQLDLVKLDPGYRVLFQNDPKPIDIAADRDANLELFESVEPGSGVRMAGYLDSANETYELAKQYFLYSTFEDFRPLLKSPVLKRSPRLVRLLLESLDSFAARAVKDPKLQQILGYPAVFLGSSPFTTPSMYHLMSHLDMDDGVLYPQGGLNTVIETIAALAVDAGVTVITGASVTQIVTTDGVPDAAAAAAPGAYDYETTEFDTTVIDRDELRRVLAGEGDDVDPARRSAVAATAVAGAPGRAPAHAGGVATAGRAGAVGAAGAGAAASAPGAPAVAPGRSKPAVAGIQYLDEHGAAHTIDADIVVAATDLEHVETTMLLPELQTYPASYWEKKTAGPSAVLIYLGVSGELPELLHHTLFFTSSWKDDFGKIFGAKQSVFGGKGPTSVPSPASIYVCRPSATDASVAPEGAENLFVLVPLPADPGIGHGGENGSGSAQVEAIADEVIAQIGVWAGIPDFASRITLRRTVGPADFRDDLNTWKGTALGPAHTLGQSAFFRAGNVSKKVDNLFYAGGSTIPGIGLPMCLISAELVVERLRGDVSTTALPEPL